MQGILTGAACIAAAGAGTRTAAVLAAAAGSAAPSSLVLRFDCLLPEGCAEYAPLYSILRPVNNSNMVVQHINVLPAHAGLRSASFLQRLDQVS